MSTMELRESSHRFDESMAKAVSRAKELGVALKQPLFFKWAEAFEGIRLQGVQIANAKGRSKTDIEKDITSFKGKLAAQQEGEIS